MLARAINYADYFNTKRADVERKQWLKELYHVFIFPCEDLDDKIGSSNNIKHTAE